MHKNRGFTIYGSWKEVHNKGFFLKFFDYTSFIVLILFFLFWLNLWYDIVGIICLSTSFLICLWKMGVVKTFDKKNQGQGY